MRKKLLPFIIISCLVAAAGCGGIDPAASLPYPTKVEFADGKVSGDISILTGRSVRFIAEDDDGNPADADDVEVVMTKTDGSIIGKEYGGCSTSDENPSEIICRAPEALPDDPNPRVRYTFVSNGTPVTVADGKKTVPKESRLAKYTGRLVVSPDAVDDGRYEFTRMLELQGCRTPHISSNGAGWVFLACLAHSGHKKNTLRLYWSNDDGETWAGPGEIFDVSNTGIVHARRIIGSKKTSKAIIAYNANGQLNVTEIAGDEGGNISFGATYSADGRIYDAYLGKGYDVHIVARTDSAACPGGNSIANIHYMKLADGIFSEGTQINTIDCSAKADRYGYPKIISSTNGAVYVVWRSIDDGDDLESDVISMHVSEIDPAAEVVSRDDIISSVEVADADEAWASGQHATMDKDGNLIVSWDEAVMRAGDNSMRIYVSLFADLDSFTSYLMDEVADIDPTNPFEMSGTSVIPDYAKGYHLFYRDGEDLVYVLGELTETGMKTTRSKKISSSDGIAAGRVHADTDWSGKNFLAWQEGDGDLYATVVAVGTMK